MTPTNARHQTRPPAPPLAEAPARESLHANGGPPGSEPATEARESIESWLAMLRTLLRTSPKERDAITEELRDHLSTRTRDLMLQGREETSAAAIAIRELGDAAGVARQYQREDTRTRRRTMLGYAAAVGFTTAATFLGITAWDQAHPEINAEVFTERAADREISAKLAEKTVPAGETTYGDAFAALAAAYGTDLLVDWGSLEEAGIARDEPLMITERDAARAFAEILAEAREEHAVLDWRLRGESMVIASQRTFDKRETKLVSYDISILIDAGIEYDDMTQAIIRFVDSDVWVDMGGDLAQMQFVGTRLFVEAPQRMHPKILWILKEIIAGETGGMGEMSGMHEENASNPSFGDGLHESEHATLPSAGGGAGRRAK